MSKKILYFISEDWFFCSHFMERAVAARNAGYEVVVVAREGEHGGQIRNAGLKLIPIGIDRRSTSLLSELRVLVSLYRIYKRERPDIVHNIAVKPILYGTVIARFLGIGGVVNAPVGMGYIFSSSDAKAKLLRPLIMAAYRLFLGAKNGCAIFENDHDRALFIRLGFVKSTQAFLIRGAGIDLDLFRPHPEPDGKPLVVLIARMLKDKGVVEFLEAARILNQQNVVARIVLVGTPDLGNPATLTVETLHQWNGKFGVEWWGWRNDIPEVLKMAHVVCLPSYREGLPKSLLEASACGLPIVTTDAVGCRDVVHDGVNGYLVPVRDSVQLASAIKKLVDSPALRIQMGAEGRRIAEAEFSSARIIAETLAVYSNMVPVTQ